MFQEFFFRGYLKHNIKKKCNLKNEIRILASSEQNFGLFGAEFWPLRSRTLASLEQNFGLFGAELWPLVSGNFGLFVSGTLNSCEQNFGLFVSRILDSL